MLPTEDAAWVGEELTRRFGVARWLFTLTATDANRTAIRMGPGGCTAAWGLQPDMLTVGKAIGGGGTLAGNALSSAAMRATLEHVLTDDAYAHTVPLAARFSDGVRGVFAARGLAWEVTQLGCRAEYRFQAEPARNGGEAQAAGDPELERYLHLHALNRGVLLTPFHNMALMCPATTAADVDRHTEVFDEAVAAVAG
jgi:glutamate-1-semialdehyde 2,1-aminomutase